jgi:hypothetical protein
MRPRKSIFDQAASYYTRQNYFAYNLRQQEVEDLDARKNITDRAKWTWARLKFIFLKSEQPGWLVKNGKPMSTQALANVLRRRQPDTLQNDLDQLLDSGILKVHKGFICDPGVIADEEERKRLGKHRGNTEEPCRDFEETPRKHQNSLSGHTDVSNSRNSSNKGTAGDRVSNQMSGNSNSMSSRTTTRRTTATVQTDKDSQDNAHTSAAPSGAASALIQKYEHLREEFPNIDFEAALAKLASHFSGQKDFSEKQVRGWLKKERPINSAGKPVKPKTPKKSKPKKSHEKSQSTVTRETAVDVDQQRKAEEARKAQEAAQLKRDEAKRQLDAECDQIVRDNCNYNGTEGKGLKFWRRADRRIIETNLRHVIYTKPEGTYDKPAMMEAIDRYLAANN